MTNNNDLTAEQQQQVEETLQRIRTGLQLPVESQFEEPAHFFVPEAFDVAE